MVVVIFERPKPKFSSFLQSQIRLAGAWLMEKAINDPSQEPIKKENVKKMLTAEIARANGLKKAIHQRFIDHKIIEVVEKKFLYVFSYKQYLWREPESKQQLIDSFGVFFKEETPTSVDLNAVLLFSLIRACKLEKEVFKQKVSPTTAQALPKAYFWQQNLLAAALAELLIERREGVKELLEEILDAAEMIADAVGEAADADGGASDGGDGGDGGGGD